MRVVKADRKKWARGRPGINGKARFNLLLDGCGNMCCLGIYLRACGVSAEDILGACDPNDMDNSAVPDEAQWLFKEGNIDGASEDTCGLVLCNDKSTRQTADEKLITAIFAKHDVDFQFVGSGVPDLRPYRRLPSDD